MWYLLAAFHAENNMLGQDLLSLLLSKDPDYDEVVTELIKVWISFESNNVLVLEDYHNILLPEIHELVERLIRHSNKRGSS